MPNIIRDRAALAGASLEDLNATYRALRGTPDHPGFNSRAAAEVQVGMAIMAAQDAAGHRGVPAGHKPPVLTAEELAAAPNPYAPGSISHRLHEAIAAQQPIQPRPKVADKKDPSAPKRHRVTHVRAVEGGTSAPRAGSDRNKVLQAIRSAPDQTASLDALREQLGLDPRGYVQKLIEKGHLVAITPEGNP